MSSQLIFFLSVAFSFTSWGILTWRYIWPQLRGHDRSEALQPILILHTFRFIGLAFLLTGVTATELPSSFANPAAYGDFISAILALISLILLRRPGGMAVVWLFNVWGTADLLNAPYQALRAGIPPGQFGAMYFIPTVIVPMLLISHLIVFAILLRPPVTAKIRKSFLAAATFAGILQTVSGESVQASVSASDSSTALAQHQAEAVFPGYEFRDGETLPELRIHYTTLGQPHKNAAGSVDNAVLLLHWTNASSQALLTPEYKEALFAPGAPLDTGRYFVVIPDDIGHGQSSKPSDGLEGAFPQYGYGDMVDLQHKLLVEALGIRHLRAIVGMSMGCMNAWQWSEDYPDSMDGIMPIACFPAAISGRNLLWRRILVDSLKSDPSGGTAFAIARMMIDGVPNLQQEVSSPEAADAFIRGIKSQSGGQDANNVIHSFEASRDFDAEPGLSRIQAKVYALNFADDEFYRDSLQILQHDIRQVRQQRVVIRPPSSGSAGHFTMSHPALWRDQVQAFMTWLETP